VDRKKIDKDEVYEDNIQKINRKDLETVIKKNSERIERYKIKRNIEMETPQKIQDNQHTHLLVSSEKEETKNKDVDGVPNLEPINNNQSRKKSLIYIKSSKKNKTFYLNEDVMANLTDKKKNIVYGLFERLDYDFIKEKKNKKISDFDEHYYRKVILLLDLVTKL